MIRILVFLLSFTLVIYGQTKQVIAQEPTAAIAKPIDFNSAYEQFFKAVARADYKVFNQYIHPEKGLFVIESSPNGPVPVNVEDISNFFRRRDSKPFFSFNKKTIILKVQKEPLPILDCEQPSNPWSKEGMFTSEENRLMQEGFKRKMIVRENERKQLEKMIDDIDVTVVNTDNYTWYFSFINMEWFVTFIDIRKHC
ncbi:MAG: hypothetical protein H0X62_13280 [Bacteroidetes bacterium]|nr:hypothetical protein [Bacteroidota bacterium]